MVYFLLIVYLHVERIKKARRRQKLRKCFFFVFCDKTFEEMLHFKVCEMLVLVVCSLEAHVA